MTASESNQAWAIVARGGPQPMQEMQEALAEAGVTAHLVPPEDCASGGCGPQLRLAVAAADLPAAARAIQAHLDRGLDPEALTHAHKVADFDAEEVECPACAARFASTLRRCPECDLNFGD